MFVGNGHGPFGKGYQDDTRGNGTRFYQLKGATCSGLARRRVARRVASVSRSGLGAAVFKGGEPTSVGNILRLQPGSYGGPQAYNHVCHRTNESRKKSRFRLRSEKADSQQTKAQKTTKRPSNNDTAGNSLCRHIQTHHFDGDQLGENHHRVVEVFWIWQGSLSCLPLYKLFFHIQ